MTSAVATWGANVLGKAWALNEKVEAARPHAKIEAIFAIVAFPVMHPWYERFLISFLSKRKSNTKIEREFDRDQLGRI